jgi:hypothetical protein
MGIPFVLSGIGWSQVLDLKSLSEVKFIPFAFGVGNVGESNNVAMIDIQNPFRTILFLVNIATFPVSACGWYILQRLDGGTDRTEKTLAFVSGQ